MTINPVSTSNLQVHNDNHAPTTVQGIAITAVSGGMFAYLGSQAASASSGLNSINSDGTDVWVGGPASGANVPAGVVQVATGSASPVSVIKDGIQIISRAGGDIVPGDLVAVADDGSDSVVAGSQASFSSVELQRLAGRALTGAGSAGYCLHTVNFM